MTGSLLLLGASGDLASRLLLPALGQLLTIQPDRSLQLVGAGMDEMSADEWRARVASSFETGTASGQGVEQLLAGTAYHQSDVTQTDALTALLAACDGAPAIYFALPPPITAAVCEALVGVDLPDGVQLALEKPFGTDADDAAGLNARLSGLVDERQIHRVDHFLGRSTVLNLLGLRFANRVLEPVWSNEHVERVDIVYDELLGLEGRAGYYDRAGALVDMIQSHLLQVMAVLAMEPPATLEEHLREAKGDVLRDTRAVDAGRRARYAAGVVNGRELPSYVDEEGVDPSRDTETLAEVTVEIQNRRWSGVPFTLRSGKALGERRREVVVTFKPAVQVPVGLRGLEDPTVLRIALGPDELRLELNINGPGDPYVIDRTTMTATFGPGELDAYGEVLEGILDADPSLSVRGDAAEQCWRIVEPVLAAWRGGEVPLEEYPAGSAGPPAWSR